MSLLGLIHESALTSYSESTRSPEDAESHMIELNDITITSFQDLQDFRLIFEDRCVTLEVRHGLGDVSKRIQETLQYLQP